jgi:tetratricopeptide (TPR) repeat protein
MGLPLLLEYYNELPEPRGEQSNSWEKKLRIALEDFRTKIQVRYSEGTLQRLAGSTDVRNRRAAILALGMIGSMRVSNAYVAARLHDEDAGARQLASDALWSMWFRSDSEENNAELQKALEVRDRRKRRARLDALIVKAPQFAEALNQRAILHFENEDWALSISDCERVLKLNPFHFGAAAGMGRCYIKLRKNRAALKAFRTAIRVNPTMGEVEEAIRALENALGEEGRRDDKK